VEWFGSQVSPNPFGSLDQIRLTEHYSATIQYIEDISSFLPYFGNLEQSQTVGLFNGSLYDVLTETYPGNMTAEVEAFGFNITCGYLPGVNLETDSEDSFNISLALEQASAWLAFPVSGEYIMRMIRVFPLMSHSGPDVLLLYAPNLFPEHSATLDLGLSNSIIVYTTNHVLDSYGNMGGVVAVNSPLTNTSHIQFLQCSKSLIKQKARVETGSSKILQASLEPVLQKNHSKWHMYGGVLVETPDDSTLIEGNAVRGEQEV
jgi:hypothetical protein